MLDVSAEKRPAEFLLSLTAGKHKNLMKIRSILIASLSVLTALTAGAGTISETFTNDPSQRGWQAFGNTNLFTWDSTNQNLQVTWDSTSPNSYYYLPLGKVFTTNDAFTLSFDLNLTDITPINFGQEIAVGLFRLSEATNATFARTAFDPNSPDLVEFDYFPDTGFGNSLGTTMADFTVSPANDSDFYFTDGPEPLVPGVTYHIVINHAAGSSIVSGQVYTNGVLYSAEAGVFSGPITDFHVDTLAIESYADDGFGDDILAHGTVDNITFSYSPPEASETVVMENFFSDPAQTGWNTFGNTNLFQWDSTNEVLDVTWDSSQSNSYYYKALGTTLTMADAFAVDFDIELNDLEYTNSFELALGLLNLGYATDPAFSRATGYSPDLFEFDYFPDDGLGEPSISATMADDTGGVASFPDFYFIYDNLPMNPSTLYHVRLEHAAGSAMLTGDVLTNGVVYTTLPYAFPGTLTNFQMDTVAVCNYSGAGQDPAFAGSILAHGTVDNFIVTLPPPSRNLVVTNNGSQWQVQFGSFLNWQYTLQRSTNLVNWGDAALPAGGTGQTMTLTDTNLATINAFYRISASQP